MGVMIFCFISGLGAVDLAKSVMRACNEAKTTNFRFLYPVELSIEEKIEKIVQEMYGAAGVEYSELAKKKLDVYRQQVIRAKNSS